MKVKKSTWTTIASALAFSAVHFVTSFMAFAHNDTVPWIKPSVTWKLAGSVLLFPLTLIPANDFPLGVLFGANSLLWGLCALGIWTMMRGIPRSKILGGTIAAPFGIYYGIVLGTLGGAWGERLLGSIGVPIGIVFTVCVVSGVVIALGAFLGQCIGLLMQRYLSQGRY